MLSLRSLVFVVGNAGISKRDEAEEWAESVAIPARLICSGGRRELILEDGKDVVRGFV